MANLNFIPKSVITDCEVNDAIEREIRLGFQLEKAMGEQRQRSAAEEAAEFRKNNRTVPGFGKIAACLDPRDFHRAVQKYGHEEVHSREFVRSIRKYEPELTVNRV
jgi:hypothetical protein